MFATQHWLGCEAWRSLSLRFWGTTTWQVWISGTFLVKRPLYLYYLINSWDKLMLPQSQKMRNSFYFPGWSPLYTKFMEMPSSFCKIPVNFMIRKVFSLIGILLMIESTNCQILILGKILWLILVWAAVWKANKIVLAVFPPHSNSQRFLSFMNFLRDSKFV